MFHLPLRLRLEKSHYVNYNIARCSIKSWWRHQMETFSALLALCAGNSPVPVNSPHKGQWRGALMFSLICAKINDWVNNREAGDLRRHLGHCDVIVMCCENENKRYVITSNHVQRFYYLICQSIWCQNASKSIYQKGEIMCLWDTQNAVYCKFGFDVSRWTGRRQKSNGHENRPTQGWLFFFKTPGVPFCPHVPFCLDYTLPHWGLITISQVYSGHHFFNSVPEPMITYYQFDP